MHKTYKTIIENTPHGPIALVWQLLFKRLQIVKIIISKPDCPADREILRLFPDINDASSPEIDIICSKISAYLAGERIEFSLELTRLDTCSAFQQAVLRSNYMIPRGSVCSYRTLATHLSNPKASRAVGTALATNPFPILIPCHRIIRSDHTLGGFGGGLQMKRALLEMEGVLFDKAGTVAKCSICHQPI